MVSNSSRTGSKVENTLPFFDFLISLNPVKTICSAKMQSFVLLPTKFGQALGPNSLIRKKNLYQYSILYHELNFTDPTSGGRKRNI